jgi:hypothetical protein
MLQGCYKGAHLGGNLVVLLADGSGELVLFVLEQAHELILLIAW